MFVSVDNCWPTDGWDETLKKREQKTSVNAVSSNTIASLSYILPAGFVVHFLVDRLKTVKQGSIAVFYRLVSFHVR